VSDAGPSVSDAAPLPSEAAASTPAASSSPTTPARPPAPQFKFSTMILAFLFILGIYMLFDAQFRAQVAGGVDYLLRPTIGFGGTAILLTMLIAAVIEMMITAIAYNWTTDWVKAAKVQKWSGAFRKVQMEALRSGKKDRIEALKVHQQKLTALSSEVSFAQLKGMAVTWFLVIAIYTWVGLFIASFAISEAGVQVLNVNMGGVSVNLLEKLGGFIPLWFLIFSLYTIPSSIALRRVLKHFVLARRLARSPSTGSPPGATGGTA
jgi:uncharacterized membrane protein (DUF106 family)